MKFPNYTCGSCPVSLAIDHYEDFANEYKNIDDFIAQNCKDCELYKINSLSDEEVKEAYRKCVREAVDSAESVYDAIHSLTSEVTKRLDILKVVAAARNIDF